MLLLLLSCSGPEEAWLYAQEVESATLRFASARIAIEGSYQAFLWPSLEVHTVDGQVREVPMNIEGLGVGMAFEFVATKAEVELDLREQVRPGSALTGRYWGWHAGATAWDKGIERGSYIKTNGIRMRADADSWGLGASVGADRLRMRVDETDGWLDQAPFQDTGDTGDTGEPQG